MNRDRVTSGKDIPDDINVTIEIPSHSDPVRHEADKDAGTMFVDRFMSTAAHYPCNDGYIRHTLAEDGDPVDKLCTPYRGARKPEDMPGLLLAQIAPCFEHDKDLKPNQRVKVEGWLGPDEARIEIAAGVGRCQNPRDKPFV